MASCCPNYPSFVLLYCASKEFLMSLVTSNLHVIEYYYTAIYLWRNLYTFMNYVSQSLCHFVVLTPKFMVGEATFYITV